MVKSIRARSLLFALALAGTAAAAQGPEPAQGQPGQERPRAAAQGDAQESRARTCDGLDVRDVIARTAESIDRKVVIDPRVRACVTLVPMSQNPTFAELLTILRIHGYMAVDVGGFINVIPDAFARQMPTRLVQRDERDIPDDEWVTRVLTVNANATRLVPILRPMMHQSAHLAATQEPNVLIIVDTYANVRRITEIIEALGD